MADNLVASPDRHKSDDDRSGFSFHELQGASAFGRAMVLVSMPDPPAPLLPARVVLPLLFGSLGLSMLIVSLIWPEWLDETRNLSLPDAVMAAGWYGLLCAMLVAVLRLKGRRLPKPLFEPLPRAASLAWCAVTAIALIIVSAGLFQLTLIPLSHFSAELVDFLLDQSDLGLWVRSGKLAALATALNLLSILVLAPIIEELVFRRLLFVRWLSRWGFSRAMLLSSALFGLLHLNPLGTFVFSCVQSWVYFRTASFSAIVLIHALNNGIAIAPLVFAGGSGAVDVGPELLQNAWLGALLVIPGAGLLWLQGRRLLARV